MQTKIKGKPRGVDELLSGGRSQSPKSVNRFMDSTLSQRLSAIPKERASTVLSSIDGDDSKGGYDIRAGMINIQNMTHDRTPDRS